MDKFTVSEYARTINKSVQAVYLMISNGKIRAEKIGNKTFVYVERIEQKEHSSTSNELLKLENEMLKELIKSKDSEIETLKSSLNVFTIVFNNRINEKPTFMDVEIIKTKKNKKNRKNK
jgi:hypothetical protein